MIWVVHVLFLEGLYKHVCFDFDQLFVYIYGELATVADALFLFLLYFCVLCMHEWIWQCVRSSIQWHFKIGQI